MPFNTFLLSETQILNGIGHDDIYTRVRCMKRLTAAIVASLGAFGTAFAQVETQESWTGIYLQGNKIGYASSKTSQADTWKRVDSQTVIAAGMLGADMKMDVKQRSDYDGKGKIQSLRFEMNSGGRTMVVTAAFNATNIITTQASGGPETKKTIPIPAGATVLDDATAGITDLKKGERKEVYVFDAPSLSLVKVLLYEKPLADIEVKGVKHKGARTYHIEDSRAPMTIYLDAKGEMLKTVGPMGMEMIPEPKEIALKVDGGGAAAADLANASSIKTNKPIRAPNSRTSLTLRVKGFDLGKTPSDEHQTIKKDGDSWLVTIHPADPKSATSSIKLGQQKEWTEPDTRIPADSPEFKKVAKEIVGSETDPLKAAEKLRQYVYRTVGVNAGIGVLRDATEILETKEGVCRDHAVVMATLCRAAGIPTRLVNGLVYDSGRFYYHAWVEVYSGQKWFGFDSTRPAPRLTATHFKTAQGTAADALTSFLLDGATIEVVEGAAASAGEKD